MPEYWLLRRHCNQVWIHPEHKNDYPAPFPTIRWWPGVIPTQYRWKYLPELRLTTLWVVVLSARKTFTSEEGRCTRIKATFKRWEKIHHFEDIKPHKVSLNFVSTTSSPLHWRWYSWNKIFENFKIQYGTSEWCYSVFFDEVVSAAGMRQQTKRCTGWRRSLAERVLTPFSLHYHSEVTMRTWNLPKWQFNLLNSKIKFCKSSREQTLTRWRMQQYLAKNVVRA